MQHEQALDEEHELVQEPDLELLWHTEQGHDDEVEPAWHSEQSGSGWEDDFFEDFFELRA